MKKLIPLLLSLFLITACSSKNETIALLEKSSRWKGTATHTLEDGLLELTGEYQTLVYDPGFFRTFENFEFSTEIRTQQGATGSILFHTSSKNLSQGYAVVVDNSPTGNWDHLQKTGSLKYVRNVCYQTLGDQEWFILTIRVIENHVLITINSKPVVDYIEPEVPFRMGNSAGMRLGSGTVALQTEFGNTGISFRNMTIKPLPKGDVQTNDDPDFVRKITQYHNRNFPVVDYHVHEKGDLTLPLLMERSAKLGINYGVAANCGLKFPIENDEQLQQYQKSIAGLPIFKAMQAEGREWVDMFSSELVNEFDYAFTDAMTWTNHRGTRMRLWIPEETDVGDPEDFMDQLVSQIEKIVTEPIAIYVNPTYLPEEIAGRYDELWTDERIDRVVEALKANNVALEINSRLQLPGDRVIEKAKAAGVKFALGTNNTNSENLGKLEWALEKVDQHNLQPADMFLPRTEN